MRSRLATAAIASIPALAIPSLASAQVIYSDDFNSSSDAANYNVIATATATGGPSSDATFGYDYSALGIPSNSQHHRRHHPRPPPPRGQPRHHRPNRHRRRRD